MKYNKSEIMSKAWDMAKGFGITFAEALHRAWELAKNVWRVVEAIKANGIKEAVATWYQWKESGRMVAHGSKCLFQVSLYGATKNKPYIASYFGYSQTVEAEA